MQKKCPVLVIFAPTACGKTAFVTEMFGKSSLFPFKERAEVVCADSQTVYKGLNIGTAKPSESETNEIPHHLLDLISPDVQFGVGEFIENADKICAEIFKRQKLPILVGGSGFYIKNFILGLPQTPPSDQKVRDSLKKRLENEGNEKLYAKLQEVDPDYAKKISKNDFYRLLRALEVFEISNRPLSSFKLPDKCREQYDFCTLILTRPREELYARINERVEQMFKAGLPLEVEQLRKSGYTKESPGMKAIGYSEFFIPNYSQAQIKEKIKSHSRRYAKKQYTFMQEIPNAIKIPADDLQKLQYIIEDFCKKHLSLWN